MNGGPLPAGAFNLSANDPGRITWTNVWLLRMIQIAYDFPPDRISAPDWLKTERFIAPPRKSLGMLSKVPGTV
jgi:uncharacterized protein (TIGR03435 family)